ncbi:hypothetical protein Pla22_18540 [Rubripirellula amarantea]|uniref:Uncharacterized protein n=1 Tax=Rubripirellula amarantea TaxID=2527999 RepID=A0A5C5WVD7_9BACT|nr:hypothetical protein Pla22_18540 [Rubripirellula amarantea]
MGTVPWHRPVYTEDHKQKNLVDPLGGDEVQNSTIFVSPQEKGA